MNYTIQMQVRSREYYVCVYRAGKLLRSRYVSSNSFDAEQASYLVRDTILSVGGDGTSVRTLPTMDFTEARCFWDDCAFSPETATYWDGQYEPVCQAHLPEVEAAVQDVINDIDSRMG